MDGLTFSVTHPICSMCNIREKDYYKIKKLEAENKKFREELSKISGECVECMDDSCEYNCHFKGEACMGEDCNIYIAKQALKGEHGEE